MTKLYKWTTARGKTRDGLPGETQWGEGVEHTAPGGELCTSCVIHAYETPELSVLMMSLHCPGYKLLWECDGDVVASDGTKVGCTRLRTIRQVEPPVVTAEQAVRFAIGAAWSFGSDAWQRWAARWLDGTDRSLETARQAESTTKWAAETKAAARSAKAAAELEYWGAASTAWTAMWAARATGAAAAAAFWAARQAADRAATASMASLVAVVARKELPPFAALAEWAVSDAGIEDMPGYDGEVEE